jgi:hypothetical protein
MSNLSMFKIHPNASIYIHANAKIVVIANS